MSEPFDLDRLGRDFARLFGRPMRPVDPPAEPEPAAEADDPVALATACCAWAALACVAWAACVPREDRWLPALVAAVPFGLALALDAFRPERRR